MNYEEFNKRLIIALEKAKFRLQEEAPKDTCNLAFNAIKLESLGQGKWRLYVDENIAPYMKYTNETWEIGKLINSGNFIRGQTVQRVRASNNPNEGWWNWAIELVLKLVAIELGGELTKEG